MPQITGDVLQKRKSDELRKTVSISKADGVFSELRLINEATLKTKRSYTEEY